MASLVNPFNINGNYPIAGQDNDSQGFRDNFTNIKNNFIFIKQEVEDLQAKVILKSALAGSSLDNNFLGSQVKNIQTKNQSETVYDWGEVGGATATEIQLDLALGNIHKINATGSIKINSVIKNWPASLQYARLLLYINIDSVESTLELPSTLTTSLAGIPGLRQIAATKLITFTDSGDYIFEFSSVDSGTTTFVRELTKGNPVFRDPNFYMAGIGGFDVPTLRLGWGNLFATSAAIDSNTKAGTDTFSVRGAVTSFQNFTDGGNDPATMTTAGFSVAKSRTLSNTTNPTEAPVNSADYLGYFNGLGLTALSDGSGVRRFQSLASIGMYATGSNTSYGLGGNIVISTKRDGGDMAAALTIDNNQNVVFKGNVQIDGVQTIINSTILTVDDKQIVIAQGADPVIASQVNAAGIVVDSVYANLLYFADDGALAADLRDRWHSNKGFTVSVNTASTTASSGALVVTGGVGIGGALNVGGSFGLTSTTEATTTTAAAFTLLGGMATAKNIIAGGAMFANSTAVASNLASGSFQVQGGALIKGNLYIGGQSAEGPTKTGLYVLATSESTSTATGAMVIKGGAGVSGNVYLSDAASANGVVVTSTLNVSGTAMTNANATARSSSAALRVMGGSVFEGNIVIGVGSSSSQIGPGRVFIDNDVDVTLGDIKTGGLVLGNATARVGLSVSGDMNIGTDTSGTILNLSKTAAKGTPTLAGTLTPYEVDTVVVGLDTVPLYGAMTSLGGVNVFGDIYVGQPHDGRNYDNATKTWTGSINPATNVPVGAWSGNAYLTSGARATTFNTGALVIKEVATADGGTHAGGAGIAGNLYVNQAGVIGSLGSSSSFANLVAASSTESTGLTTGSLVTLGGAGVALRLNVGGNLVAAAATASTSKTTGAIVVPSGGMGVSGGITAGNIGLDAGTASQESLRIAPGVVLTSAKEGALELASGIWYATPVTNNRAAITATHMYVISGQAVLAGGFAPASTSVGYGIFGGGTPGTIGTFSAQASTTYEFEVRVVQTWAVTPTSHDLRFTFGGTATYTAFSYDCHVLDLASGGTPTAAAVQTHFRGTTTLPTVSTGTVLAATTSTEKVITIRGHLVTNAAGTILPQFAFGTLPGQIVRSELGSWFKITPRGSTATITTGNFTTS
jgi:hypothetical protein